MSASRTEWITVARVGEIAEGGVKIVRVEDQELAVFHVEGGYHVIEDVCTHDGGPLAEGVLEGRVIECPRHGARFDVITGEVLAPPAVVPVPRYEVKVSGDQIQVAWSTRAPSTTPATRAGMPAAPTAPAATPPPSAAPAPSSTSSASAAAPAGSAPGPSQQELAVRSALETVMDPEIGLSVIDLGLIRDVTIGADKTVVRMLLTTPFCPYAPQMIADVKSATQSVVPQECDVEVLPDAWSPEMMPDPSLLGFSY
jgi:3-phenylpropionate/trans-cinnamate dioxygenase ferredoxin subunit